MQRKPPRRTRERILELSLRLFNDLGEPNVTTSAIADEMNISPGNLYYHFRNKDDIVNALFEQFEREIDPLLDGPLRREIHFEDAWLFLHLLFESIWRYRFIYRDLNDLLSRNRRLEMHFRTIVDRKTAAARSLCQSLAATGALAASARPAARASRGRAARTRCCRCSPPASRTRAANCSTAFRANTSGTDPTTPTRSRPWPGGPRFPTPTSATSTRPPR